MMQEIKGTDVRRFRIISSTKIEIELNTPIDRSHYDLHIDIQVTGAYATMAAAAGSESRSILDCKPISET